MPAGRVAASVAVVAPAQRRGKPGNWPSIWPRRRCAGGADGRPRDIRCSSGSASCRRPLPAARPAANKPRTSPTPPAAAIRTRPDQAAARPPAARARRPGNAARDPPRAQRTPAAGTSPGPRPPSACRGAPGPPPASRRACRWPAAVILRRAGAIRRNSPAARPPWTRRAPRGTSRPPGAASPPVAGSRGRRANAAPRPRPSARPPETELVSESRTPGHTSSGDAWRLSKDDLPGTWSRAR